MTHSIPLPAAVWRLAGTAVAFAFTFAAPVGAGELGEEPGRNESRVWSAAFEVPPAGRVAALALPERLERQGYVRVHRRPAAPGEYFHGHEVFWFYRRAVYARGRAWPATLVGLDLDREQGRIRGRRGADGKVRPFAAGEVWLEPELLAESLDEARAVRVPIDLDALPERVWRPVLAAEDARFFEHDGVDPRAVARAALANLRRGGVAQGGSTITQQLIKNRDLSPRRTLSRKASEAVRAHALEKLHSKREILAAYLDTVYLGNVDGLAVHGFGTAAGVYFSKRAGELTLAEAAALAAMIQGPNRLSPFGDAADLRTRRDWVLGRLGELGWASDDEVARARAEPLRARKSAPRPAGPHHFLARVARQAAAEAPRRNARGRGFRVETTLDPWLQAQAEEAARRHLALLRRQHPALRAAGDLAVALVTLDARSGAVLASVGGDPDARPAAAGPDRVRSARRQPGSVVKPFVALEALDRCGEREPLTASSRITDAPLTLELPAGPWRPENFDRRFAGVVLLREALAESRNVPAVRIARWCGFDATAATFERAGFDLPAPPPPAFVLGAVEATPLEVAAAYTVFATPGRRLEPFDIARLETAAGGGIARTRGGRGRRVASPAAAYLVRDLLRTAVERGTATAGELAGVEAAAKTGSSSDLRDAWFAGQAGSLVTVVWVGRDGGGRLGLTGARAAGPLWHDFMAAAVPARPAYRVDRPEGVVERWVEPGTGRLVAAGRPGARRELYRAGTLPEHRRWWRLDRPLPAIE